ncbi:MAG TPA: hypothetical protein EYG06_06845 [Myxococcales bacterium]|nr:hypothetical protein [Myxococcales bacterium]
MDAAHRGSRLQCVEGSRAVAGSRCERAILAEQSFGAFVEGMGALTLELDDDAPGVGVSPRGGIRVEDTHE